MNKDKKSVEKGQSVGKEQRDNTGEKGTMKRKLNLAVRPKEVKKKIGN